MRIFDAGACAVCVRRSMQGFRQIRETPEMTERVTR